MTATTTDPAAKSTRPKPTAPAGPAVNGGWWKTLKLATGLFVAVFGLMTWHMAVGHDPLMGSGWPSARAQQATVHRKLIVRRKVIIEEQPAVVVQAGGVQGGAAQAPVAPGVASPGSGTAVTQAPAPVAPAPAPAPVTQSS